jgi:hypothetical protein
METAVAGELEEGRSSVTHRCFPCQPAREPIKEGHDTKRNEQKRCRSRCTTAPAHDCGIDHRKTAGVMRGREGLWLLGNA